jgi:hypothetical protein
MALILDGTSGASLVQPAVITQAALGTNVVGNGPAFSVYKSSGQSLASGVATKFQADIKEFDTANAYDNTTNFRFTPQVGGYYQINAGFQITSTQTSLTLLLYKNGTAYKSLQNVPSSSGSSVYGSALVFLNGSTDYVEIFFAQAAATQNTTFNASSTYFQGFIVRSST